MDSSLDFALKSLSFGEKNSRTHFKTSIFSENYLILTSSWKSQNSEKTIFSRAMGPKKWISHSIYNQNHSFGQKNFFIKFFKELIKTMAVLVKKKWKSKGNSYKKV